jgi:cellulose synthase (UDP-forming)
LPVPPTDQEKYEYLTSKKRWVMVVQLVACAFVTFSTVRFIRHVDYTEWFCVPVVISGAWALVSFATTTQGRRDTQASHDLKVALYAPAEYPSIDVFLPSCGEPLEVIENTYHYVARMEWPGVLQVHVLDDAASSAVQELARRYGFVYHSRPDRGRLKKAGNLRYGFEHTDGDLITVFDADFAPRRDFLRELVPYFDDLTVGIVQSPQYFDVTPDQSWIQRAAGAGQEFFYRWVQPSRDKSNGAICVGTNAIYRREALNRSGGFAQIGHSEDVHTGVNMIKVGYVTRYVPVQLAKGLCPTSLAPFISQQYRWCAGSMSLLFSKEFHRTSMPVLQRMCFWSGFLYYISTAIEVFTAPLPPIVMAWLKPGWVQPKNYAFILIAVTMWYLVYPVITTGRGQRIGAARLQVVYSFAHAVALWHVARNRPAEWVPTGVKQEKRGTPLASKVRILAVTYISVVQVALWSGILIHAPEYGWAKWWPMTIFALLNLIVVAPLLTTAFSRRREPSAAKVAPTFPKPRVVLDPAPS